MIHRDRSAVQEVEFFYQLNKKSTMNSILKYLDGKKVIIAGIIVTTAAYLGARGVFAADTVVYISTLCTIVFGSAAVYTQKNRDEL